MPRQTQALTTHLAGLGDGLPLLHSGGSFCLLSLNVLRSTDGCGLLDAPQLGGADECRSWRRRVTANHAGTTSTEHIATGNDRHVPTATYTRRSALQNRHAVRHLAPTSRQEARGSVQHEPRRTASRRPQTHQPRGGTGHHGVHYAYRNLTWLSMCVSPALERTPAAKLAATAAAGFCAGSGRVKTSRLSSTTTRAEQVR